MLLLSEPPVIKPLTRDEDLFSVRPSWLSPAEFVYSADGQLWRRGIAEADPPSGASVCGGRGRDAATAGANAGARRCRRAARAAASAGIARTADARRACFQRAWRLVVARARQSSSGSPTMLYVEIDPTFAPDGESIVFASDRTGAMNLVAADVGESAGRAVDVRRRRMRLRPRSARKGRRLAFLEADGLGPVGAESIAVARPWSVDDDRNVGRGLARTRRSCNGKRAGQALAVVTRARRATALRFGDRSGVRAQTRIVAAPSHRRRSRRRLRTPSKSTSRSKFTPAARS